MSVGVGVEAEGMLRVGECSGSITQVIIVLLVLGHDGKLSEDAVQGASGALGGVRCVAMLTSQCWCSSPSLFSIIGSWVDPLRVCTTLPVIHLLKVRSTVVAHMAAANSDLRSLTCTA